MDLNLKGKQTMVFPAPPSILETASVVGPLEGRGPLGDSFDIIKEDTLSGQDSWEKAECRMMEEAAQLCLKKAGLRETDVGLFVAGDLLNQCINANFAARNLSIPFLGLYGACSTMVEALIIAAMAVEGRYAKYALAATSSHHDTAERQLRYPTEFANQRAPTAQWTVTASGAALVGYGNRPVISMATIGKVVDLGGTDPNDMGSAMAPAAADTIWQHLQDTGRTPEDYDLILTGDLGQVGTAAMRVLLEGEGVDVSRVHQDSGLLIFPRDQTDVNAGGSGCGCVAAAFTGHIYKGLLEGRLARVLVVATGALHSPTSVQQGESIPCIAQAVVVEVPGP
jgi:stage V sporulation protein AD